jgi:integrase
VTVYLDRGGEARFLLPISDLWEGKSLSEITQQEVDRVARELYPNGSAATLVRQVYGPVVSVLRAAKGSELVGSFVPLLRKPRVRRQPVTYATDGYLAMLLEHCPHNLRSAVLLMTFTGLRTGEVLRLTEEDFRVRPGWVSALKTKTGKPRMIPLPDGWEYPQGGFGFRSSQGFNKALRRACEAAGLPYLSGHKIGRHAFAARLLAAGHSLKVVKEAGGWASMKVLEENYGHLELSQVHEAMRAVSRKK